MVPTPFGHVLSHRYSAKMVYAGIIPPELFSPEFVQSLQIAQVFLNFLLFIWVGFYHRILTRKEVCHPNLRILLTGQPTIHLIALTSRTVRFFAEILHISTPEFSKFIHLVSDIGLSCTCVIVIGYCVERIYAMTHIETYDQKFRPVPWLGLAILMCSLAYSTFLLCLWYSGFMRLQEIYYLQITIFSCSSFFFIGIKWSSLKAYERVQQCRTSNINLRFQTVQNFRAARLLLYLAPYKCISSLLILVFYIVVYDSINEEFGPLYTELFFLYNYVQVSLQILLVLLCHEGLRRQFLSYLHCRPGKIASMEGRLRSVTGTQMSFKAEQETGIYFNNLKASWDAELPEEKEKKRKQRRPRKAGDEV